MNPRLRLFACVGALGLFLALFPGCYTQMGASRNEDEHGEGYGYNNQGQYQDTSYSDSGQRYDDGYYNDNWGPRPYYGFSYYYPSYYWPSYAFNAAYCDPWAFNFGFDYYGYPRYSPYPYNFGGYYSPYYPGGYYTGYYPYYGQNGYPVYPYHRGSRVFGDTRGVSSGGRGTTVNIPTDASAPPPVVNVDRGGYNFPTGARSASNPTGGAVHNSVPATVNHNRAPNRGDASVRGSARPNGRSGHAVRGWGQRRGGSAPVGRGTTQSRPNEQNSPPPPQQSTPRSNDGNRGGRDAGTQRGSSPAPRPEAPSSGGRSSGSIRGGRP